MKSFTEKLFRIFVGIIVALLLQATVAVASPLTFFSANRNSPTLSTYYSPYGNGIITITSSATSGSSTNDAQLWYSKFATLFPAANNNWANNAQTVRIISTGTFALTIDLTQFHNISPAFVFGFYNITEQGSYTMAAYDSANVQLGPPFTWNLIGNEDDSLHPQASSHLLLDAANGAFSTQVYQTGEHSDAAFWNHIPANTAKIVITGQVPGVDGVTFYFAETSCCDLISCPTNKTVGCGVSWDFDSPTNGCPDPVAWTLIGTTTNGTCPLTATRSWQLIDDCGRTNNCSQTVTVAGAPITIAVNGSNNIFGAGHTIAPNPGGGGAGLLPPSHSFAAGPGKVLKFSSVTGIATMTVCCASNTADGYFNFAPTDINSVGGISGIRHDGASFLVGVFLGPDEPLDPAPARLDFRSSALSTNFTQLSPIIGQTFYIGDGLTGGGSGTVQKFVVPPTATRLFLGLADAPGYTGNAGAYEDNGGLYTATFDLTETFICASNKTVECGTAWEFDPPTPACAGPLALTVLSTVTNGTCPVEVTRTWQVVDTCGTTNTCSQIVTVLPAPPVTLVVSGTANIFGAGHTTPPNPGLGGPGILPPSHSFAAGPGKVLKFSSVTGIASMTVCCASNTADGYFNIAATDINSWNGISGIRHDGAGFMVGVFLGPDEPTNPAPSRLDFRASATSTNFTHLSPGIGQTFFIGDGMTGGGSGAIQVFEVPPTATRLFLGLADAPNYLGNPGAYEDNGGAYTATFEIKETVNRAADKIVQCGSRWQFDPPTPVCSGLITLDVLNTVTNGTCPQVTTRTWLAVDGCGNSNVCSQSVTIAGPLTFFAATRSNSTVSTYNSPNGNGSVTLTASVIGGSSSVQNDVLLWASRFPTLFPSANNNWGNDAQSVRVIGSGDFALTIDLTQYHNLSPAFVFGLYNITDQGTYTMTAFDAANAQLNPPFAWNLIGNEDDGLHPQASSHLLLNPANGAFATQFYQTGTHSDAAFWNHIPSNTAKIVITGHVPTSQDGVTVYFAEPSCCDFISCSTNKTVDCGKPWNFDPPIFLGACAGTNLTILSTITNGVCPKNVTRTWAATDSCGNSNACSQTVTLADYSPPIVECPAKRISVALTTNCSLQIPTIQPPATDNCTPRAQLVFNQDPAAGSIVAGPCQLVTITIQDACANVSQCQVMVCGEDKTPPTLNCLASVTATNCTVPNVAAMMSASDNCTSSNRLIFTQSPPAGTTIAAGGNSVTVTVTDEAGNTASCTIPLIVGGLGSFHDLLHNTGVSLGGAVLSGGSVDPHYHLGPVAADTATGPGFYHEPDAVVVDGPWQLPPFTNSKWIAPGSNAGPYPIGAYTYTNEFVLPTGADPSTASIAGRWAADDGAVMYFNGQSAANQISIIPANSPMGYTRWTDFTINRGFLANPAVNKLYFVVTNAETFLGYSGLRLEFLHAAINCSTCTPPVIILQTPDQQKPLFGTATFSVTVWGTPTLSYQWYRNGIALSNSGTYSGVNTANLVVNPLSLTNAGVYHVVVSNACGQKISARRKLIVTKPWGPWSWGWWNFIHVGRPLVATFGPDLVMKGTNHLGVSSGTTIDFGLPNLGGKPVNVAYVPPLAAGNFLKLPFIAPAGSNSLRSFTILMDVFVPSDAPSIKIVEIKGDESPDNINLSTVSGPTGRRLLLTGNVGGQTINMVSSTAPIPDNWNRFTLRSRMSANEASASGALKIFIDGQPAGELTGLAPSLVLGTNSTISICSSTDGTTTGAYIADLQFHSTDLSEEIISEIGSPKNGPMTANEPFLPLGPGPRLGTLPNYSNGVVNISWTGNGFLQETWDLDGDGWTESSAPFDQTEGPDGEIVTTARINITVTPVNDPPTKFYRVKQR